MKVLRKTLLLRKILHKQFRQYILLFRNDHSQKQQVDRQDLAL